MLRMAAQTESTKDLSMNFRDDVLARRKASSHRSPDGFRVVREQGATVQGHIGHQKTLVSFFSVRRYLI
jgi:hypothetical protein